MKLLDRLILFFLAAVFLFSGVDKVFHLDGFENALRSYVVVPHGTARYLAVPLIASELLVGLGLLIRPWRRKAAASAVVLLVLFTAALALNRLLGGRQICGCWFTITLAKGTASHILQNLIMAGLAASQWWTPKPAAAPDEACPSPRPEPA